MSGLGVQVKIEGANQAVTDANKVTTALGKTEDKGPAVGESIAKGLAQAQRALTNLGQGFRSLESAMNARIRATETHARLTNTLANSMGGVVEAMQREQRILNEMRGPMQRYEQDLQAINALHARGAITANEHAAAMARARSAAGMGNAASTISLPGMPKKGSSPSALAGAGSGLGSAAGALGITLGAKEVMDLSDSYTGLQNRMRQVTKSQSDLNSSMARIRDIATNTRSDLATTGESYVRLVQATKNMGVSQERAFKITETLSMSLQSSGRTASEAAAGTLQLMQALGAGALQGDEFRSVAENMPQILDVLSQQLGVTRGELKKLGAEGKLTTDVMVKALEAMGPNAKKAFEQSEMTFSQAGTLIKNKATEVIGSFEKATTVTLNWGQQLRDAMDPTKRLASAVHDLDVAYKASRAQVGYLIEGTEGMTAATYALTKSQLEHMRNLSTITALVADQLTHMEKLRKEVERLASVDLWGDSRTGWQKFVDRVETRGSMAMSAFKKHIDEVQDAAKKAADEMQRLSDAYGKMLRSPTTPGDIPGFDKFGGNDAYSRYVESEIERLSTPPDPDLAADLAAHDGGRNPWDKKKRPNYLNDMWNRELDEATRRGEQFRDDMRNISQEIGQGFVDAAFEGRMEWDRMFQSMTMNMVKLLAMQALRSQGFDTSLLGGLKMPGFATGGSFMVGGNGATDTTPVAFMATPGERVTVETPGQQGGGGGSGAPLNLAIHLDDRDALRAIETPEGQRVIAKIVRRMMPAIRGPVTGR